MLALALPKLSTAAAEGEGGGGGGGGGREANISILWELLLPLACLPGINRTKDIESKSASNMGRGKQL